ncbi:MAG: hypothetical protein RLY86_1564 [Pseudomonadota bacterium]|jgi:urease accessory protein
MLAGGAAGVTGLIGAAALPVEPGILLSVILLGALVALARPRVGASGSGASGAGAIEPGADGLAAAVATLVALSGAVHGFAHGAELPAGAGALAYGTGALVMTALLHGTGILAARTLMDRLGSRAAAGALRLSGLAIGTGGPVLAVSTLSF